MTLPGHVHFVGIGGIGLSALARNWLAQGWTASGTDGKPSRVTASLEAAGLRFRLGHAAANVPPETVRVVRTAAIPDDNPEIAEARRREIPVLKYAEALGLLLEGRRGIAVAGCHGKTTTTGWIGWLLQEAGRDPGVVVGGWVDQLGGNARVGRGEELVVEACEYDRSFHHYRPSIAVLTNIEEDHLDYYRDLDEIIESFRVFAHRTDPDGVVIGCADDPHVRRILREFGARGIDYALRGEAEWTAADVRPDGPGWRFAAYRRGCPHGEFRTGLAGRHNVANAMAVIAVAERLGIDPAVTARVVAGYRGADRRFQTVGERDGVLVIDDYAHHPTEIRSVIRAAQARFPGRPLWCVFQPHQHSRTLRLMKDFARAFEGADLVLLPDIYAARDSEADVRAVSSADLARAVALNGQRALHLGTFESIVAHLRTNAQPGTVVITMGAGNVDEVGRRFLGAEEDVHGTGRAPNQRTSSSTPVGVPSDVHGTGQAA